MSQAVVTYFVITASLVTASSVASAFVQNRMSPIRRQRWLTATIFGLTGMTLVIVESLTSHVLLSIPSNTLMLLCLLFMGYASLDPYGQEELRLPIYWVIVGTIFAYVITLWVSGGLIAVARAALFSLAVVIMSVFLLTTALARSVTYRYLILFALYAGAHCIRLVAASVVRIAGDQYYDSVVTLFIIASTVVFFATWQIMLLIETMVSHNTHLSRQFLTQQRLSHELISINQTHLLSVDQTHKTGKLATLDRLLSVLGHSDGLVGAAVYRISECDQSLRLHRQYGFSADIVQLLAEVKHAVPLPIEPFLSRALIIETRAECKDTVLRKRLDRDGIISLAAFPIAHEDERSIILLLAFEHHPTQVQESLPALQSVIAQVEASVRITDLAESLKKSRLKYRSIFDGVGDAIFVHDETGSLLDVNHMALCRLGFTREEMMAKSMAALEPVVGETPYPSRTRAAIENGGMSYESIHMTKDGASIPVWVVLSPVNYGGVQAFVSTARDITERKQLEQRLELMARTDALTGLLNRQALMEHIEREIHRIERIGGTLAVIYLDIDDFKKVNDTFGHEAGDRVLKSVAEILQDGIRSIDVAARLGGEELCIAIPAADLQAGLDVAERLRLAVSADVIDVDGLTISCTASWGVAQWRNGEKFEELLRRADEAMYTAKKNGKNRVVSATEMRVSQSASVATVQSGESPTASGKVSHGSAKRRGLGARPLAHDRTQTASQQNP